MLTQLIEIFITLIFIIINILLLWTDVQNRKLPNKMLIFLIALLPVWWLIFPIKNLYDIYPHVILIFTLLLWWIALQHKKKFIWSGDIKYSIILLLYLWSSSIGYFIGNIGFLAIILLVFLWIVLIFELSHTQYLYKEVREFLWWRDKVRKFSKKIGNFILDWWLLGFFITQLMKDVSNEVFLIIPAQQDIYLLFSLLIFFIRPYIKYLLFEWKYRIFSIFFWILYFWKLIEVTWLDYFIQDIKTYAKYILPYVLILMTIHSITRKTFSLYDKMLEMRTSGDVSNHSNIQSIPFSIILFSAFICTYFFNVSFFEIIQSLVS